MEKKLIVWEKAQAAFEAFDKELSDGVEDILKSKELARTVSPCCRCLFRKMRKEFREQWPERLEKILLRQDKDKRRGPVSTRNFPRR